MKEKELTTFLVDLFSQGEVIIAPLITEISEKDQQLATAILQQAYDKAIQNMPHQAPNFDADAALWAARYLYRTIQLILIRHLEEAAIQKHLQAYTGTHDAAAIYSMDLSLRYLPNLFHLAKGLAPGDVLVQYLNQLALKYPFSSVGIEVKVLIDHTLILEHPSLKVAYIDRIVEAKDKKRIQQYQLEPYIAEVLGDYQKELWPEY